MSFTVHTTGTEPLNYQWQWKPAGSKKWQLCDLEGSDGAEVTIPSAQKSCEGQYRCVVSNNAGSEISRPAKLDPSKSSHWESPGNHDRIARSIVIVSRSIYRVYRGSTACIVEVPCVPRVFHERPNVRAFTRFLVKIFDSSRKQGDNARRKYTNELCSTEGYRNTFVIKCVSINGLDDTGSSTKVQVR